MTRLFLLFLATLSVALAAGAELKVPPPPVENGYLKLDFYWLSKFEFQRPDANTESGEGQIPAIIKTWNGRKIILTGYMLPLVLDGGKTKEFLLMANLMLCCYGTVPKINDWVLVRLPGGTAVIQDQPLEFRGTFHVGAQFEDGILSSIYQLDAEGPGVLRD